MKRFNANKVSDENGEFYGYVTVEGGHFFADTDVVVIDYAENPMEIVRTTERMANRGEVVVLDCGDDSWYITFLNWRDHA